MDDQDYKRIHLEKTAMACLPAPFETQNAQQTPERLDEMSRKRIPFKCLFKSLSRMLSSPLPASAFSQSIYFRQFRRLVELDLRCVEGQCLSALHPLGLHSFLSVAERHCLEG